MMRLNCSSWTPLIYSSYRGDKQAVKILLDAGADINLRSNPTIYHPNLKINTPQTPLSIAITRGWADIVELLLERGANSNAEKKQNIISGVTSAKASKTTPSKLFQQKLGIQCDPVTHRYYTIPTSPEINQNEYHSLVWQCKDLKKQHSAMVAQYQAWNSSFGRSGAQAMITEHLQRIATPTSIRLLEDLKKKDFEF